MENETAVTTLSPAAQAVLDAAMDTPEEQPYEFDIAAALRAAAEILSQDQMDHYAPDIINDIAAELEGSL
jgi:hypothetical protein